MLITVQGTHSVRVPPERATVHLTASAESGSRDKAVSDAARTANRVAETWASAKDDGLESYVVEPVRVHAWRPSDVNGRRLAERVSATVELSATFTDFAVLASFVTDAASRTGLQVGWVQWSLTEATRERVEAGLLTEAIAKARTRAQAMAAAEGEPDIEVVEVADPGLLGDMGAGTSGPGFYGASARALKADAGGGEQVDPVPEDIELSASVHVRFRAVDKPAPRRRQAAS